MTADLEMIAKMTPEERATYRKNFHIFNFKKVSSNLYKVFNGNGKYKGKIVLNDPDDDEIRDWFDGDVWTFYPANAYAPGTDYVDGLEDAIANVKVALAKPY